MRATLPAAHVLLAPSLSAMSKVGSLEQFDAFPESTLLLTLLALTPP